MNISIRSSMAAIQAFGTKMAVSANNVANLSTDNFNKSRADIVEGVNGNVEVEITKVMTPGPESTQLNNGQNEAKAHSNVDLTEEIPHTLINQRGYEANLKMIRAKDKMTATVIDMIG